MNNDIYFNHLFLDGNVTRGCNIDLSENEYEICRKDDSCTLCQDDYCNKEEIDSGANTTTSSLFCICVLLVTYFTQIY